MVTIRMAKEADIPRFLELLNEYMHELFNKTSTLTVRHCMEDGFGCCFDIMLAESNNQIIGFGVWESSYDIHWGIRGGNILDLYVQRIYRGYGVAVQMGAAIAREIQIHGGLFMKTLAVSDDTADFYKRVMVGFGAQECIIGGKAFRELGFLSGKSPTEIVRNLPQKEWNYEE